MRWLNAAAWVVCAFIAGGVQAGAEPAVERLPWMIDLTGENVRNVERHDYKAFVEESGEVASEAVHMLKPVPPVGYVVYIDWRIYTEDLEGTEHSLLDGDFGTMSVKTTIPERRTDYVVRRDGIRLNFDGVYRGEPLDKTVDIDSDPFFTNPTIGLRGFVLSANEEGRFWMLHPDNLKVYRIKAQRLSVDTVKVDDRTVRAVRVKWGLTGIKALFYSQVYWFRASDGLFVRSEASDGVYTVWTGER